MTLHEALKTLPNDTRLRDLYSLFGGTRTVGELLTRRDESGYEVRKGRDGKAEIAPVGNAALLREE